jgi:cellulose synthase (UDP-forming)
MTTTVAPPDIAPYGWLLPPSDEEKLQYLRAPQHRWIFVVSAMAFAGVAASLAGFATQSYWTAVFLLPLALLVVEQAISLRTSTLPRRVTLPDHQFLVETYAPARYPSVDVFLPTAGEDVELLKNTYRHVARLRWPGALTVNVLDDVGNQTVAELAADYGFRYLARPGNEFKKAGNLHYAYTRTSNEFILILDADFVPRPDFLLETVPYFEQESVGVVQSPQYFSTSRSMPWLERCAGATQELFFRHIQPSRDSVAAAICVGTSAVYRRAALQTIGGFPLIPHSEDVFTGVLLGRKGYRVQYVPVVLSRGRCPDEIGAFLAQQYRWCEGSMALIADRRFHEDASMTGMQRLSFWAGFLYYVTTAVMAVLAPLPVLVMVTFFPANINMMNLLPLLGVVVLWLLVFPAVSLSRWRIEVLRVQTLYGFAHLFSMLDAARGKVMEWVATGAGSAPRRTVAHRVQRFMVPYLAVTQVLVFAGLLYGAMEFGVLRYSFNMAFALLGAYVFLPVVWLGRGAFVPAPRPAGRHGRGTGTERAISPRAHVIDLRSRRPVGRHAARVTSEPAKARGA